MDYKLLAEAGFIVDAILLKQDGKYYLEDQGVKYDLSAIMDHLLDKEIRLTVISKEVLLDIERSVVNNLEN